MKRLSLVFVTSILAVAILFGALMGQASVAHAASIPNSTQSVSTSAALQAVISKVELHVHVVNHHATIDSQLKALVTPQQFQTAQLAVNTYNKLAASALQPSNSHQVSSTISSRVHPNYSYNCAYISNGTMDNIAWALIFGGGFYTIVGIIAALFSAGLGAPFAIAGVLIGIGGAYLLWYSDKYWLNGTTWCADSNGAVWHWAD